MRMNFYPFEDHVVFHTEYHDLSYFKTDVLILLILHREQYLANEMFFRHCITIQMYIHYRKE